MSSNSAIVVKPTYVGEIQYGEYTDESEVIRAVFVDQFNDNFESVAVYCTLVQEASHISEQSQRLQHGQASWVTHHCKIYSNSPRTHH